MKADVEKGTAGIWHQENRYPGEPIFVPSPDSDAEDEGVVLSVVLDASERNSFLLILDAHTFEEVARARVPHPMPYGFHGGFFNRTPG